MGLKGIKRRKKETKNRLKSPYSAVFVSRQTQQPVLPCLQPHCIVQILFKRPFCYLDAKMVIRMQDVRHGGEDVLHAVHALVVVVVCEHYYYLLAFLVTQLNQKYEKEVVA